LTAPLPLTLPSEPIEQVIERLPGSTRRLAAQLALPLDLQAVWEVLTDYERLPNFIPNLERSSLVERRGDVVVLEQVGSQRFVGLRFTAYVRLQLHERREQGVLDFEMLLGDFRRFQGTWTVLADPGGVRLRYELTVQACVGMPIGLIEQRLQEDLASNLRSVALEALRRVDERQGQSPLQEPADRQQDAVGASAPLP
jgi:ribosome-associated toxin RatA of RatAB toxin-antitoxin module